MKFYIASRLKNANEVRELTNELEDKGHTCTHKWVDEGSLKPYEKNIEQSQAVATEQIEAVNNCDVFILLNPDEDGTGMYVELGAALAKNKQIYVVGQFEKPIFLFHPAVDHVENTEDLLKLI